MFSDGSRAPLRILIASANEAARGLFMQAAGSRSGCRIVGSIRSGERVLERVLLSAPDVFLVHMDELSRDAQMLTVLRQKLPQVKVVVCASQLSREVIGRHLQEGVSEVVVLPSHDEGERACDNEAIVAKIGALLDSAQAAHHAAVLAPAAKVASTDDACAVQSSRKTLAPEALLIGSSTGGPVALANLLRAIPKSFPLPVAVVQHMPPLFTAKLAERLDEVCPLDVREGAHGMPFVPGRVVVAPGDFHMRLRRRGRDLHLELDRDERDQSCRPAVNNLFRSAAEVYGGHVAAVVLTGMGKDGLQGVEQLYPLGARIVVQDAATSTVWGMPGAIAHAGLADAVLPLNEIIPDLMRYV